MRKCKKLVAMFIIIAILMSNMMLLLNNVSIATQTNVTVEISADSDSMIKLESDNETLTYTCDDNSTYSFNLKQGDNNITFIKQTDEVDGRFYDKYVATNISSNEDVFITCPNMNLGKLSLMYNGKSIGMWEQEVKGYWATQTLNQLTDDSDYNHYQIRIESVHNDPKPEDEHGDEHYNDVDWANEEYDVDFGEATWEVRGKTITAEVEGKDLCNGPVKLKGNEVIKLTGYDDELMEAVLIRSNELDYFERLRVNEDGTTWVINRNGNGNFYPNDIPFIFAVQKRTGSEEQEDDWVERPKPNTTAIVTLSSNLNYEGSFEKAVIEINGYPINDEIDIGEDLPSNNNAHYYYIESENNGKVTFNFSTLFIQKYVGNITINGKDYKVSDYLDYTNRTQWLNHYGHQIVTFQIEVDKADSYDIVANVTDLEGQYHWVGNFLWTDDEREKDSDLYIGHSLFKILKIVYEIDDVEYTVEGNDLYHDRFIEYDPYGDFGSLTVPEGAKCYAKIIPDYGYQVVTFGINENAIITGESISEFIFPIHKGNFHLAAQTIEVDDVVESKSDKVKNGTIEIDGNEIDSGSVILTVSDANLDDNKKKEFILEAGEYTVNTYLDIDLDQVIYKGTSEDVWANRIEELKNEAVIELQLEDDIDGNNIILVHNIHDGNEYEIIEIDSYDPETNTITFKTNSFSNYAIASKGEAEPKEPAEYTVTFNSNEGSTVESIIVNENENVEEPEEPTKDGFKFEGWFVDSTLTTAFDFETNITANITLYAKWTEEVPEEEPGKEDEDIPNEEEKDETQEYKLTSDNLTLTFTDETGHEYDIMLVDALNLSEEERQALGVSKEEYEQIQNEITNTTKEYGTLLNVYVIEIGDENRDYTGKADIKIKITEELKKYNTFKLINLDDDNNFEIGDIVILKQDGEYLVGTLPHLSVYALVGDTIEENAQNENPENTENIEVVEETSSANENINNPKTGDIGIGVWVTLMIVSFIGIMGTTKKTRKRK